MGYCLNHQQAYNENLGGFCVYCGNPENTIKTWTTSIGTVPPPDWYQMGDDGVIFPVYSKVYPPDWYQMGDDGVIFPVYSKV